MAYLAGEIKRQVVQDGDHHYTGVRVFVVEHSGIKSLRKALYGKRMPMESGWDAPYCHRVEFELDNPNVSRARVTAYYQTRRQPGTAQVSIITQAATEEVTKDLKGNTIVGPYFDEKDTHYGHGLNYYKIVRGKNVKTEGQAMVRVETSFERTGFSAQQINRLMLLQGRINDSDLPNFGDFPKGTLKLERSPLTQKWEESGLWYLDLVFSVSPIFPESWNAWTQKQLHTKVVRQGPILDSAGAIVAATYRNMEYEIPRRTRVAIAAGTGTFSIDSYDATIEATTLFREADFLDIDRIIVWNQ